MAELTLRPTANGSFNAWSPKGALANWEEVAQTAVDPAKPLTTRGSVSTAALNQRQSYQFTWPTLTAGQKITKVAIHFNGKWTAKLKPNALDGTGVGLPEAELEASLAGSEWAGASGWTLVKGAGSAFPWEPWTLAQLEKLTGGGNFQVTLNTGKASVQENFEIEVRVTVEGGGTNFPRTGEDSISISTAVARQIALPRSQAADSLSVSESTARTAANPRSVADSLAVSDAVLGGRGNPRSVADSLAVSEGVVRSTGAVRGPSDTIPTSEAATRAPLSFLRSASDAITVAEAVVRSLNRPRPVGDTIPVSEAASRAPLGLSRTVTDTVSVAEAASRRVTVARTVSDTVPLSTSVAFTTAHTGAVLEAVITISSRKQTVITPTGRRQVDILISSRRQVDIQIKGVR